MKEPSRLFEWVRKHPLQDIFNSEHEHFHSGYKITGLVRINGDRISFLAVTSEDPGKGNFTRFLDRCEKEYNEIHFLHVWNAWLGRTLVRRGYSPNSEKVEGEVLNALIWRKPKEN